MTYVSDRERQIAEIIHEELDDPRVTWAAIDAAARRIAQTVDEGAVLEEAVARMGWDEIHAFEDEMRKGQSVFEDAGGFVMRGIRRLFGLPPADVASGEVLTYQRAARAMVARVRRECKHQWDSWAAKQGSFGSTTAGVQERACKKCGLKQTRSYG